MRREELAATHAWAVVILLFCMGVVPLLPLLFLLAVIFAATGC